MRLRSAKVNVTVENTKGKEFEIKGTYWGDGTIRVDNPRPEKYPFQFLYTEPDIFDDDDPKRLFWLADEDAEVGDLSPFRIKYMMLDHKSLVKKPGAKTK
jgi:hypothetical protein